jgi:site-specific DNA-methyltransferase (adenine-specific)
VLYHEEAGIQIHLGDCREIIPTLPRPSCIITDPPYSEQTHKGAQSQTYGIGNPFISFPSMNVCDLIDILDLCAPERWCILTCDWKHVLPISLGTKQRFVRMGVWIKPDGCPQFTGDRPAPGWEAVAILHNPTEKLRWNNGGGKAVWTYLRGRDSSHPCEKPIGLLYDWIEAFTDKDELILDPFCGSGTTLRAAKDLGRRAIGIEISESYCEVAASRLGQQVLDFDARVSL